MCVKMSSDKKSRIKEELKELGLSTTGHVIALIVKSKYLPMKIFLFLAWLVGVALTLYLLITNIMDFYKYEVTTKTRLIREVPMIFPKVTICNSDPFVTNASIPFLASVIRNDSHFSAKVIDAIEDGAITDLDLVNWIIDNNVDFTPKALYMALTADQATRSSIGFDRKTFVKECWFDDTECPDNFIQSTYEIGMGNCFTFNGKTQLKSKKSGNFD